MPEAEDVDSDDEDDFLNALLDEDQEPVTHDAERDHEGFAEDQSFEDEQLLKRSNRDNSYTEDAPIRPFDPVQDRADQAALQEWMSSAFIARRIDNLTDHVAY